MKLFYFFLFLILITNCKDGKEPQQQKSHVNAERENVTSDDNLKLILNKVKTYSESYTPVPKPGGYIADLSNVPDSITYFFRQLRINDHKDYYKYITLLFLKLYRSHLECCHQGYELRRGRADNIDSMADPLLYEFNLVTNSFDNTKRIEFVNSAMPVTWIEKNPSLLNYPYIAIESKRIAQIGDSIQKGLYWKDRLP